MTGTDRRDEELRRYEAILDSIDDAVYAVRPDGTIAYVNDRYAEMKGAGREELLGTQIYDWVTEEAAERARAVRREMAAGERDDGVVEYEFLTADGERFPVEMRFSFIAGGGDDHEPGDEAFDEFDRVGVIRDVSDRKRREEALREKNERLAEFASIVSHDLRNPLNVAEGRLDLAREECDSEHLDHVARAHNRMNVLIEDLLTVARDGEDVDETERVPLRGFVEECWEGVETADATLRVETDRAVRADRSRLRQVFENLARNSVEHGSTGSRTESGDSVEHGSESVTLTVGDLDGGFYVADDGPGIPEADRERVFDPGYTTSDGGTGFGLDIVEAVATAHGWDVRVTDADGGGARFEFTGVDVVD
ncbi:PAS domain-containing sensor histidine kinase [Halorubrum sp. AJ67]|uniref:PAS domain-containing sensor histidine kinase n=1 Tax=Halorubrum sp. AJ67 TaxID=1173487 RepID=UPI0003DDE470|nr:PAS domain-containing sensor histidine kinase [Halorubrum sp. AJ67]CDK39282.1 PAS/PAC sensor signal transduction histidine kinase [Halorubrum sp. AJ67]